MSDHKTSIEAANAKLERVVAETCGQCDESCCHQGTMMGLQGLRRLARGVALDPALGGRVREGLLARQKELVHDLEVVERVAELLRAASLPAESRETLPELDRRISEFRRFVTYLDCGFALDVEGMRPLLHYSAVRHNLLRCLRQFPGAEAALSTLARGRGSFAFRGRKLAPPRCIFHHERCLAEHWKPVKCGSFFCTNEPNLLARCREVMTFDEFVMASLRAVPADFLRRLLALEARWGQDYWEPLVIIGPDAGWEDFHEQLIREVSEQRPEVRVVRDSGRFMRSTNEIMAEVQSLSPDQTLVCTCQSVDGVALYELAVAMDRARSQDWHGGFVLLAGQLADRSFLPHPLWEDQMISQPLGGLEVYFCI